MAVNSEAVYGTSAILTAKPSDSPWVRWVSKAENIYCYIDAVGSVEVVADTDSFDVATAKIVGSGSIPVSRNGEKISLTVPQPKVVGPAVIELRKK
jgi:alpha-L-fucosidase